jgi:hypothetical protein
MKILLPLLLALLALAACSDDPAAPTLSVTLSGPASAKGRSSLDEQGTPVYECVLPLVVTVAGGRSGSEVQLTRLSARFAYLGGEGPPSTDVLDSAAVMNTLGASRVSTGQPLRVQLPLWTFDPAAPFRTELRATYREVGSARSDSTAALTFRCE